MLIRTVDYERLQMLVGQLNEKYNGHCEFVLNNDRLMPYLNRKNNIIEFSNRLNTILTLFTAYKYEPEQLHKTLFLFLLANKHVETGNWYNANIVLKELRKAQRNLSISHPAIPNDIVFYIDYQTEAMLAHEYGHHIFSTDEHFLIETEQKIENLFWSAQKGIKRILARCLGGGIFKSRHLMEELACDWFAMTVISEHLKSTNDVNIDNEDVFRQIIRMFISISYFDDIFSSKLKLSKSGIAKTCFNIMRVGVISSCLHEEWEEVTPSIMFEELRESRRRIRVAKKLFRNLKYFRMRKDVSYLTTQTERENIKNDLLYIEKDLYYNFDDRFLLDAFDSHFSDFFSSMNNSPPE